MYKGYLIDLDGTAYRGCEVINETLQFVKKLHEKLREIRMEGMGEHTFTFSAGIAFAPQDGDTFMELYQKADFALYQVKRSGRDGYRIYK